MSAARIKFMHLISRRYAVLALSILGSASLLFSCSSNPQVTQYDYEILMTESSENRTITMMENGMRSYSFVTPLMEGYSLASNPYQEFRRGINMTTYTQDSTNLVDATITANYAIYYEKQKLWEAKGNVVIIKNNRDKGDTTIKGHTKIYTQQLFWNATTKKIYSNVDTKILQPDGWHFGVGFDADEDLKNIHFRKYSSEMEFDMSQPTAEELEAENKKREEEAEKREKAKNKSNSLKNNATNKGFGEKDKRKDNTVKPSSTVRPNSEPNSIKSPSTPARPTPANMGADRKSQQRPGQSKSKATTPANNKQTTQQQKLQTKLSTSMELSSDLAPEGLELSNSMDFKVKKGE